MKLFYFSGSGNSEYVAAALAQSLSCETFEILKYGDIAEDREIGFVFPNYCSDIPAPVKEKLRRMAFPHAEYLFCIICTGAIPDGCFRSVADILQGNGMQLHYSGVVNMFPSWAVTLLPALSGLEDRLNRKAPDRIRSHAQNINLRRKKAHFPYPNRLKTALREGKYFLLRGIAGIRRQRSGSACTGCGKCAENCPAGNIKMTQGRAQFGLKCIACYKCAFDCPWEAIEFGRIPIRGKRCHRRYSR